jgi:hypothetical protein
MLVKSPLGPVWFESAREVVQLRLVVRVLVAWNQGCDGCCFQEEEQVWRPVLLVDLEDIAPDDGVRFDVAVEVAAGADEDEGPDRQVRPLLRQSGAEEPGVRTEQQLLRAFIARTEQQPVAFHAHDESGERHVASRSEQLRRVVVTAQTRFAGRGAPRQQHIEDLHGAGVANGRCGFVIGDDFEVVTGAGAGNRYVFVLALEPGFVVERTLQEATVGVLESERAGSRGAGPGDQIAAENADGAVLLGGERSRDREGEYQKEQHSDDQTAGLGIAPTSVLRPGRPVENRPQAESLPYISKV